MFPIGDDNPTLRTPVMTYAILALMVGTWLVVQGAGLNPTTLATSVCNYGMVPGEVTGRAALGTGVPIGPGLACVIDRDPVNTFTPLTSMFLHGSWMHLIGNALFFWVFGNNIEDSMGKVRFAIFYVLCGLAAAATHVFFQPASPVPTVGASGAISGTLGAYLLLYPKVRVRLLIWFIFLIRIVSVPAWLVLLYWFAVQVLTGLPELNRLDSEVSGGVAVWAHVGGFVAGMVLVKLFEDRRLVRERAMLGNPNSVWRGSF
ncbi:MAG: rhomboid family intramembrane serine protease [Gemmatimonadaceae bacterium]